MGSIIPEVNSLIAVSRAVDVKTFVKIFKSESLKIPSILWIIPKSITPILCGYLTSFLSFMNKMFPLCKSA